MEPQATRDIFDFLTAGAAVAGVMLGLFNLWLYFDQRRVKLRIRTVWAYAVGDRMQLNLQGMAETMLAIEVINLSPFPVTIREIGYRARGGKRAVVPVPLIMDGGAWPRRLEPREEFTGYLDPQCLPDAAKSGRSYAATACGVTRTGNRPNFRVAR